MQAVVHTWPSWDNHSYLLLAVVTVVASNRSNTGSYLVELSNTILYEDNLNKTVRHLITDQTTCSLIPVLPNFFTSDRLPLFLSISLPTTVTLSTVITIIYSSVGQSPIIIAT